MVSAVRKDSDGTLLMSVVYGAVGTKIALRPHGYGERSESLTYTGGMVFAYGASGYTVEGYHFGEGVMTEGDIRYHEKDHLGNVRVVTNRKGEVLEQNDYYPYGMRHPDSGHAYDAGNRYRYNGKELLERAGLYLYDFGARLYDPRTGRWYVRDPLSEKYYGLSPYNYVMGNPVNFIDPDGRDIWAVNKHGKVSIFDVGEENMLFKADEDGKLLEHYLELPDNTIVKQLAEERTDYKGHYAITDSPAVGELFHFLANHTEVEWGLDGYQGPNGREYVLRTSNSKEGVNIFRKEGYGVENMFYDMHSHHSDYQTRGGTGYGDNIYQGDKKIIVNRYYESKNLGVPLPAHYVYYTPTQELLHYTPWRNDIFIKRITSPQSFQFLTPKR